MYTMSPTRVRTHIDGSQFFQSGQAEMMEQGTHRPANPQIYGWTDAGFATPRHSKKSNKCLVYFLTLIVILSILVLIFALAILRCVQAPRVVLNYVSMPNLSKINASTPSLDGTLVAEIDITNNNFGCFVYEDSSIAFLYQNVTVGAANVTGGRVFARETGRVDVTARAISKHLLKESRNFSRDVGSGLLELRSYAEFVGRVHVVRIFKLRTSKLMNCTMTLHLASKAIQDLELSLVDWEMFEVLECGCVCSGGIWFLAVFQDFSGSKLSEVNGYGRRTIK
ncbi:late embryogenesis abundant protein At1g64065-like [Rhododendron vialii]|uniref:late embryogenesis abundant protein At1g64065-like n=1 Tax=Rhododendron vialii TaxID=182163 RepID=UPI00265E2468|nr:late embryogenesis abundant protein At1g64065-like [Rhododendron vialii]